MQIFTQKHAHTHTHDRMNREKRKNKSKQIARDFIDSQSDVGVVWRLHAKYNAFEAKAFWQPPLDRFANGRRACECVFVYVCAYLKLEVE